MIPEAANCLDAELVAAVAAALLVPQAGEVYAVRKKGLLDTSLVVQRVFENGSGSYVNYRYELTAHTCMPLLRWQAHVTAGRLVYSGRCHDT
jgi:hypothetical protein